MERLCRTDMDWSPAQTTQHLPARVQIDRLFLVSPNMDCSTNHRPSLALPASPAAPALPPLAGGDLAGPIYAIPYPKLLPPSAIPGRPSCSSAGSPSRTTWLRLGRRSWPSPGHRTCVILGGLPHRLACPRPRAWWLRDDAARRRGHQDTRTRRREPTG
jgi:hypothetical protein